jgi:hypothetical protein
MPPGTESIAASAARALAAGICPCTRSLTNPPVRSLPDLPAGMLAARPTRALAAVSHRQIGLMLPHPPPSPAPRRHCFPVSCRAATPPPHQQLPRTGSSARRGGPASIVPCAAFPLAPRSPPSAAVVPLAPPWLRVAGERRGGGGEGGAA